MKSCFTTILITLLLAAVAVGGFYIFVQQQTMEQQSMSNWKAQNRAKKKKKAAQRKTKEMQEDIDKDGLTKAEEKKLGTSDYSMDTDRDGVPDKYDIVPKGKGRNVVKYLSWTYKTPWKWEVTIPIDVISYYEKVKRPKWRGNYSYFAKFIDANDTGIQKLAEGLAGAIQTKENKKRPWTYYEEVMFVVRMVQSLRYTDDKLTGFDDYTKYPMQTINDGTGDCEDMAILAAAILHKLEYDVKLVYLDPLNSNVAHLAIAVQGENVKGTYWTKNGKKYYYIETTSNEFKFGELPEEWSRDDVKFTLVDVGS